MKIMRIILASLFLAPNAWAGRQSATIQDGVISWFDCGAGGSLDNMLVFNYEIWFNPNQTPNASRRIIMKGGNGPNLQMSIAGNTFRLLKARSITSLSYSASGFPLVSGRWYFASVNVNVNNGAGNVVNFFAGTDTMSVIPLTLGAIVEGSGVYSTDAAANWAVGSNLADALGMDVAFFSISSGTKTLAQSEEDRLAFVQSTRAALGGFWSYPLMVTSSPTAIDLSGNGNNCTMRAITDSANQPPLFLPGRPY